MALNENTPLTELLAQRHEHDGIGPEDNVELGLDMPTPEDDVKYIRWRLGELEQAS